MRAMHLRNIRTKQPNLELKTRPKQLLGFLQLAFALPAKVEVIDSDKQGGW